MLLWKRRNSAFQDDLQKHAPGRMYRPHLSVCVTVCMCISRWKILSSIKFQFNWTNFRFLFTVYFPWRLVYARLISFLSDEQFKRNLRQHQEYQSIKINIFNCQCRSSISTILSSYRFTVHVMLLLSQFLSRTSNYFAVDFQNTEISLIHRI